MVESDPAPVSNGSTFILRIWLEWSQDDSCWRGTILHLQSGKKEAFLTLEEMLRFVRVYVAIPVKETSNITENIR